MVDAVESSHVAGLPVFDLPVPENDAFLKLNSQIKMKHCQLHRRSWEHVIERRAEVLALILSTPLLKQSRA
jgi:hypothetical protein